MKQNSEPEAALASWLIQQGLDGSEQEELLLGYCEKLVDLGVPVFRVHVAQRAFHPQYGGLGFDWYRDGKVSEEHYAHSDIPVERWLKSPLYHIIQNGLGEMRQWLAGDEIDDRFPMLRDLRQSGATDYFATGVAFEKLSEGTLLDPDNTPEGFLMSWTSDAPDGFAEGHISLIRDVLPHLGLALKAAANRRMARELLGVYLGADAGNRVLSGEIQRGSLQEIDAVICYFDLTGFTSLAERTDGRQLIEMLNDYFGIVVEVIQSRGGRVLKFLGDGVLAMFDQGDMTGAAEAALDTASDLHLQLAGQNRIRKKHNLPTTGYTLALHAGRILYGNIGGENRLDFTAIGPAVNLTARLSGMHGSLGQDIIVSSEVQKLATNSSHDLVSMGRYFLRGATVPLELFTVYDPKMSQI